MGRVVTTCRRGDGRGSPGSGWPRGQGAYRSSMTGVVLSWCTPLPCAANHLHLSFFPLRLEPLRSTFFVEILLVELNST